MSNTSTASKSVTVPAYQSFMAELAARIQALGIPVTIEDRKDWIKLESTVNKHKLYVPRSMTEMSWCHTTLELERVPELITDLPKGPGSIGKIECFVAPDVDLIVGTVLPLFASSEEKLRANKRPARRKTGEQPVVQAAAASEQGSEDDLTAGMSDAEVEAYLKA